MYSTKLKLEFSILNQLITVVKTRTLTLSGIFSVVLLKEGKKKGKKKKEGKSLS